MAKRSPDRVPTDGDIVRKVKLCGLSRSGKLLQPWNDCPEIEAIVDTGATATIISRSIAELAGAEIVPGLQILHGRPSGGALVAVKLAAPGCGQRKLLVVVDDRRAATAGPRALMILGHDYLRGTRAQIDYGDGDRVRCPPRRRQRRKGA